jgi:hypothetical protein
MTEPEYVAWLAGNDSGLCRLCRARLQGAASSPRVAQEASARAAAASRLERIMQRGEAVHARSSGRTTAAGEAPQRPPRQRVAPDGPAMLVRLGDALAHASASDNIQMI